MKISIYAIKESSTGEVIYIGSTTKKLSERIPQHLTYSFNENYSKKWKRYLYKHIRETCDRKSFYDYFNVELIYTCEVSNESEKLMVERKYFDQYKPKDNVIKPYATEDERREQHRKACRKWNKNNPEKKREINRKWREKQKSLNLSES